MTGMDERTGRVLDGRAYLIQSIRRVLTTSRGSLPMARSFGVSRLSGALSSARIATTCADAAEALATADLPILVQEVRPAPGGVRNGYLRVRVRVVALDLHEPEDGVLELDVPMGASP